MWAIFLGFCALACPLSMVAMMLMMRRGRGGGPNSTDSRAACRDPDRAGEE